MSKMVSRVLLTVGAALGMWLYVQCVQIPYQKTPGPMGQPVRGNLSDLYPRWLGARELLLHGRDPYGADLTREIQIGYYGRALDASRSSDPKDQQAFAYPVYVVFLLAPTITLPFSVVRGTFILLLLLLTGISVLLWLRVLEVKITRAAKFTWLVLILGCFPTVQGIKLQQLSLLVCSLIVFSVAAITRRKLVLAGCLLGLATIKPQLVFLLVIWLLIWTIGSWRERQPLLWSFGTSVALLAGAGEFVLPGWISKFHVAMTSYYHYVGGRSVLDAVLPWTAARITGALLSAVTIWFVWRMRRGEQITSQFRWSLSLVLATTLLVIPPFAPYNQLLLLPGIMLVVPAIARLWRTNFLSRLVIAITGAAVFFPYVAATGLVIGLLFLQSATVQRAWAVPLYPSFAVPIMVYVSLLTFRKALCSPGAEAMSNVERTLRGVASSE